MPPPSLPPPSPFRPGECRLCLRLMLVLPEEDDEEAADPDRLGDDRRVLLPLPPLPLLLPLPVLLLRLLPPLMLLLRLCLPPPPPAAAEEGVGF